MSHRLPDADQRGLRLPAFAQRFVRHLIGQQLHQYFSLRVCVRLRETLPEQSQVFLVNELVHYGPCMHRVLHSGRGRFHRRDHDQSTYVGSNYRYSVSITSILRLQENPYLRWRREVDIGRTPKDDERHFGFVICHNDAFKRAGRRLQDSARRMEGMFKATKVNPSEPSYDWIPPVNSDSFKQAMARRFIFIEAASLTGRFPNRPSALGSCLPMRSAKTVRRPPTVKLLGKHVLRG